MIVYAPDADPSDFRKGGGRDRGGAGRWVPEGGCINLEMQINDTRLEGAKESRWPQLCLRGRKICRLSSGMGEKEAGWKRRS